MHRTENCYVEKVSCCNEREMGEAMENQKNVHGTSGAPFTMF